MSDVLHEFTWTVSVGPVGYVWNRAEGIEDWQLERHPDTKLRTYAPLREGMALYRELAATERTPNGVLAFASRYGHLGSAIPMVKETFGRWRYYITWIREVIRLWELILVRDTDSLAQSFRWQGSRVEYFPPPPFVNLWG